MKLKKYLSGPIIVAVTTATLGLAACSGTVEGYTAAPTLSKRPVAEWTVSRLDVRFEPGKASLAPGEEARLAAELALEDPTRPLRIVARTAAQGTPAPLAVERAATLRALIEAKGFTLQFQPQSGMAAEDPERPDQAAVYLGRYDVSVPGCPDWRKPMVTDFSNKEATNLGCANAMNLALMIADPGDLNKGNAIQAASGRREAMVVEQYQIGKQPRVGKTDAPSGKGATSLTAQ